MTESRAGRPGEPVWRTSSEFAIARTIGAIQNARPLLPITRNLELHGNIHGGNNFPFRFLREHSSFHLLGESQ